MEKTQRDSDVIYIDFLKILRTLLKKLHVIIFFGLLFGVLTYAGVYFLVTPQYETSTMLYVNNASTREGSTTITQSDLTASTQLVDTYSAIITSDSFLQEVITEADIDVEIDELAKKIETQSVNNTEVFKVSVMYDDPKAATRIANAIAEIAPSKISAIVDGSSVKVIDYASIPTEIAKPNYRKYAILGILFGLFISIVVVILRDFMDTTIKTENDLENWDLPVLGVVPDFAEAKKRATYGYGYGKQMTGAR